MRWVIDGNNVMGSRPDGWWNDPASAKARLTQQIARWCWTHDEEVVVVFDGHRVPTVEELGGGNLSVVFAERTARNAADDRIVTLLTEHRAVDPEGPWRLVTADRGLIGRVPATVEVVGPRRFLHLVAFRPGRGS